jgi:hypothetical protein
LSIPDDAPRFPTFTNAFLLGVFCLTVLFIAGETWAVLKWRGAWRVTAVVLGLVFAFFVASLVIEVSVNPLGADPLSHALWPLELLWPASGGLIGLGVLGLVRLITSRGPVRALANVKAAVAGILVEVIGWHAVLVLQFVSVAVFLVSLSGRSSDVVINRLYRDPLFVAVLILVGLAFPFLGGFTAGSLAKSVRPLQGILVGLAGLSVAILEADHPRWWQVAVDALILPMALWGAAVAESNHRLRSRTGETAAT